MIDTEGMLMKMDPDVKIGSRIDGDKTWWYVNDICFELPTSAGKPANVGLIHEYEEKPTGFAQRSMDGSIKHMEYHSYNYGFEYEAKGEGYLTSSIKIGKATREGTPERVVVQIGTGTAIFSKKRAEIGRAHV
jgi:hypothetical protein